MQDEGKGSHDGELRYKRNETILENGHCLFVIYELPGEFC